MWPKYTVEITNETLFLIATVFLIKDFFFYYNHASNLDRDATIYSDILLVDVRVSIWENWIHFINQYM